MISAYKLEANSVASTTTCVIALTSYSKNGRSERKVVLSKNLIVKNHSRIDAIAKEGTTSIQFATYFEPNICEDILVRADIGRIAQIISNLSKKNWKGGTVTLDIENRVRAGGPNKIDREIVVSISDEAEGIVSISVPSLFSKIVSAHFKRDRFRSASV